MDPPAQDVEDRKPIWDFMQNFWMDTDPAILLPRVAEVCEIKVYDGRSRSHLLERGAPGSTFQHVDVPGSRVGGIRDQLARRAYTSEASLWGTAADKTTAPVRQHWGCRPITLAPTAT